MGYAAYIDYFSIVQRDKGKFLRMRFWEYSSIMRKHNHEPIDVFKNSNVKVY